MATNSEDLTRTRTGADDEAPPFSNLGKDGNGEFNWGWMPAPPWKKSRMGCFCGAGEWIGCGVRTYQAVGNVNDTTPTSAEITSNLGTAAGVGSGFIGVIKDNDTDTNFFRVRVERHETGITLKFTKAV